ncbi:MAG: hypothetical protein FJW39_08340 [Acidobacteria bacterium]|nr:hypothetical protein [Acidobacteriota bacterium]
MSRHGQFALLLAVHASLLLSYEYYDRVERIRPEKRVAYHRAIVEGKAPIEVRTRLLIPCTAEFLARGIQRLPGFSHKEPLPGSRYSQKAFDGAYVALNIVGLLLLFVSMWRLLAEWFEPVAAYLGMALAALTVSFTFRDQFFHPWSFWEAAFFCTGMVLVRAGKTAAFAVLCVLAVVNRETSALLPFALAVHSFRSKQPSLLVASGVAGAVAAILLALRLWLGVGGPEQGYWAANFERNRQTVEYSILVNTLLLGPLWWFAVRGLRTAPLVVQSFAIALVPYVVLLLCVSVWWEIRYWLTTLPVLIPAILQAVSKPCFQKVEPPVRVHAEAQRAPVG